MVDLGRNSWRRDWKYFLEYNWKTTKTRRNLKPVCPGDLGVQNPTAIHTQRIWKEGLEVDTFSSLKSCKQTFFFYFFLTLHLMCFLFKNARHLKSACETFIKQMSNIALFSCFFGTRIIHITHSAHLNWFYLHP